MAHSAPETDVLSWHALAHKSPRPKNVEVTETSAWFCILFGREMLATQTSMLNRSTALPGRRLGQRAMIVFTRAGFRPR